MATMQNPNELNEGGVVVLETGRVLGGDSVYSYVGDYEASGGSLTARVRVRQYNSAYQGANVFGMSDQVDYRVTLTGKRDGDVIDVKVSVDGAPQMTLPARLTFIERLPG
jgi:hypothetical protein